MRVKYNDEDDILVLNTAKSKSGFGTLSSDAWVILGLERKGSKNITRVDIHGAQRRLPFDAAHGYDAETDTLTLGQKPEQGSAYQVVDNGDFVSYWQSFVGRDSCYWEVMALDLC